MSKARTFDAWQLGEIQKFIKLRAAAEAAAIEMKEQEARVAKFFPKFTEIAFPDINAVHVVRHDSSYVFMMSDFKLLTYTNGACRDSAA